MRITERFHSIARAREQFPLHDRHEWLTRVALDRALALTAIRLGALLTRCHSADPPLTYLPQEDLADQLECSVASIRRASQALEAAGYIELLPGGGRGLTSTYRLLIGSRA